MFVQWSGEAVPRRRTGVSLHSHTVHSRESLDFIYRAAAQSWPLRVVLRRGEERYRALHGSDLDLCRGWWTPPLTPSEAESVERGQIEKLNLEALVSLTDHDDIEAPLGLRISQPEREMPVSVEWTVPYRETFFHLGVHHLPAGEVRGIMAQLAAHTADPDETRLTELLEWIHRMPGTLIVLNHPLWDEKGVGEEVHRTAVRHLLAANIDYIHAFEMNGLRPGLENQLVFALARVWNRPVVSGGDRHAVEPNANLNLTMARTFGEFAEEVRDGQSEVLVMNQYRQNHRLRILHNLVDVLEPREGRTFEDRVFYAGADGMARSLRELWKDNPPAPVFWFTRIVRVFGTEPMRLALRQAGPVEEVTF